MIAKILFSLLALGVGAAFAFQSGINAGLARTIGSSLVAAAVSFSVGCLGLTALALASGQLGNHPGSLRGLPFWLWIGGGVLGAFIVASSIFLIQRLGIATVAVLIIAGQLAAAALLDHFGALGLPQHSLSLMRLCGLALVLGGAFIVRAT